MKLYTEEQVIDAISKAFRYKSNIEILKSLTPIELPSDEEIEKISENISHNYFDMHNTNHYQGLKEGAERMAKWIIEQLKQETK